jgi:DNA polymerase-3 subunit epsilon
MREIAFDTETTGLSPHDGHRVVEIGCVELVNRVETGVTWHCYLNPERSMPSEAEAVHGLSAIFLSDKKCFHEIALEFLEFVGDSPMIAHNAGFDFNFINWELTSAGHEPICMTRMVDTLVMARQRHPGAKHSLDALCTRYGVDRSSRVKHGALLDAQLLAQVYVELAGGRQIGLSLASDVASADSGPAYAQVTRAPRPVRPARPHMASAEELLAHAAFLSTVVEPLWNGLSEAA